MDDDVIVGRLRRLAEADPPVVLDHGVVLRAGRRRRLARRLGAAGAALAVVAGISPAVAALTPEPGRLVPAEPSPSVTATAEPPVRAVIDHEAGTITLPMDEYRPDPEESAVEWTAHRHFLFSCMAGRGFGELYPLDTPVVQADWARYPYGVWRADDVREVGYGPLLAKVEGVAAGRAPEGEEADAMSDCMTAAIDTGLAIDRLELLNEYPWQGWTSADDTDSGRELVEAWHRCLADHGVAPPAPDQRWMPADVPGAPFEEQVRIGLIDVACKDRLGLVQRLADLDAAGQAETLEYGEEYFAAEAAMQREVLRRAREYVREHDLRLPGDATP